LNGHLKHIENHKLVVLTSVNIFSGPHSNLIYVHNFL
jgi:hypothetical protein